MATSIAEEPNSKRWKEIVPHRKDEFIERFELFDDFLVLTMRIDGQLRIRVYPWADFENPHDVEFDETDRDLVVLNNARFDTNLLRCKFSSLKTPPLIIDYDMQTRVAKVMKRTEVLGGFDSANYATEYVRTTARDGEQVPISLVYRKEMTKRDGSAPLFMTAYGAYGFSRDPGFFAPIFSLLDRGFIYAIAHIRGGWGMGARWYDAGKIMKKKNTYKYIVDCAVMLCDAQYTSPDRLFASGRSAGGLLMGTVANMRPDLFKGIIMAVAAVDPLLVMSDASIPGTAVEYEEWGNPAIAEQYDYIRSYSPYENLQRMNYPNMLVTASLADSQVQYWEPVKYVAKLRDLKLDNNVLLLRTNVKSGSHHGSSGRFENLQERAEEYVFMLGLLGIKG